jgi:hypothetical protein
MKHFSIFRSIMRFHSTIKNPRLHQFFLDKKQDIESPNVSFDQFISNAREFLFLRSVTEIDPSDIKGKASTLRQYFTKGFEAMHQDIGTEDITILMSLYSIALEYENAGIDLMFFSEVGNVYEKNFKRSLEKYVQFVMVIDRLIPLLETIHQKPFQFLKNDILSVLQKERHTMSTEQIFKLVSILLNFQLSTDEIKFVKESIEPMAKVT